MDFRGVKGQGMSMNLIVVAAIALVVLVLIVLIFTGKIGDFVKKTESCPGTCVDEGTCSGRYQKATNDACLNSEGDTDEGKVCCISVA